MNGNVASGHRDAAEQELEDAKMHPELEDGSDEEDDDDDDDDDDNDSDASASVDASEEDDDDDDDDEEEEEESDDAKKKKKTKAKVKAKDAEPKKKKKTTKTKDADSKKTKSKDRQHKEAKATKKKSDGKKEKPSERKPHRFKPGVSAARLARKLYKDQAEYLGQSEPFVRLVERLLGHGINDEKKAVRMTRSSVQGLREIYEKDIEILVAAAGDVCRLTGQTTLSVQHLQAAVALFQRHRHMTSISSFVTLPSLKPAQELLNVLQSLGGTYEEVKRKTSRAMDTRTRILARIRHALNGKTDDELRIMAGHLNPQEQGSRRRWFDEALTRLVYVGDTTQSSAIDIEAAKVELETRKTAATTTSAPKPLTEAPTA